MNKLKVGDWVEPKFCCLGLFGKVEAVARMHGSVWLFIQGTWLPARKYQKQGEA